MLLIESSVERPAGHELGAAAKFVVPGAAGNGALLCRGWLRVMLGIECRWCNNTAAEDRTASAAEYCQCR